MTYHTNTHSHSYPALYTRCTHATSGRRASAADIRLETSDLNGLTMTSILRTPVSGAADHITVCARGCTWITVISHWAWHLLTLNLPFYKLTMKLPETQSRSTQDGLTQRRRNGNTIQTCRKPKPYAFAALYSLTLGGTHSGTHSDCE